MTAAQKRTVDFLKTIGYTVSRDCVWPILCNDETGKQVQVDFTGRQVDAGYRSKGVQP